MSNCYPGSIQACGEFVILTTHPSHQGLLRSKDMSVRRECHWPQVFYPVQWKRTAPITDPNVEVRTQTTTFEVCVPMAFILTNVRWCTLVLRNSQRQCNSPLDAHRVLPRLEWVIPRGPELYSCFCPRYRDPKSHGGRNWLGILKDKGNPSLCTSLGA